MKTFECNAAKNNHLDNYNAEFSQNKQTSLFCNSFDYKMPIPQYLGCKYNLLNWIFQHIPQDTRNVLDAFAGSQSFSFQAKKSGYLVFTNDFMSYSNQIGLSLIENKNEKLTQLDIEFLFSENKNKKDLIQKLFQNIFFTEEDCIFLDNFRANVDKLNKYKKSLALTIVNRALTRKTTMGHFAHLQALTYANNPLRVKRNPNIAKSAKEVFLQLVNDYNNAVFDNGQDNKSFQSDILELLPKIKVDLIYADPPYCGSHADYQSFYHVLETYTEYWENKEFTGGTKKYFPLKRSGFDKKSDIENSLKQFLYLSKHVPYVLFSYNDRSVPKIEYFIKLIKDFRNNVKIFEKPYGNSRGGKGSVKGSKEYLILCKT